MGYDAVQSGRWVFSEEQVQGRRWKELVLPNGWCPRTDMNLQRRECLTSSMVYPDQRRLLRMLCTIDILYISSTKPKAVYIETQKSVHCPVAPCILIGWNLPLAASDFRV
jgi:hypothetical protein